MPRQRIEIKLTEQEQEILKTYVSHGQRKAREINRARILLLSNERMKVKEISQVLGTSPATIYNVRKKYSQQAYEHILDLLKDEPRTGRPIEFDSRIEAKVSMIACSDPPRGRARWTLHLIADKLVKLEEVESISHESVRQLLKKTGSNLG